ncbi:rod-binding protein [Duganella violaceipulchra]|uniref:Flagellar protein FlgJ n=1 Tax=Duganella violaceipulchra TaxID=2849652 RepID=A0AA41L608_9BURK|nr:rod-binding protein [Duganella violaceicalia]MBV6319705.1 rod-binding protein [Duganella violaceicalia]MCP2006482.1 flagellar protein FlgJ [Duganella violaceicalia]
MNFDPSKFDGSTMRLGVADQLSETPVVAAPVIDDGVDPKYRAKATEAAVKFESFFIGHMLHQMRAGTRALSSEDSVFKDKINEDMLDMADNLVADQLAGQRAFGVADAILRQLLPPASAPLAMRASLPRQAAAAPAAGVAEPQNIPAALNPLQ